ncbi:peptidyl-prolyl cis-trans isomerase FKBP19, chloroplastic-like [Wolffia australiana]
MRLSICVGKGALARIGFSTASRFPLLGVGREAEEEKGFMALAVSVMGCRQFLRSPSSHFEGGRPEIAVQALQIHPKSSEPCSSRGGIDRRNLLLQSSVGFVGGLIPIFVKKEVAEASEFADMPALRGKDYGKSKMRYPDYTETPSGLQYKDLRVGEGPTPKVGETVVVDWDGYTIGYYGRIFEARNKTKGGSFEGDDKEFFRFRVGNQQVIPAFEEAILGMAPGGVRRIIVPPELGYPDSDYNKLGPKPTTFSGQRALDFVLRNQGLIDKTLLFDIELLKIVPGTGQMNSF